MSIQSEESGNRSPTPVFQPGTPALLCAGLLAAVNGCARPNSGELYTPPAEAQTPVVVRQEVSERTRQVISLPGIEVDLQSREIAVNGEVCIEQGVLEYVAVAAGGKEYESIFSLDCRPSHLHVAMLIAGYQAGELAPGLLGDYSPEADPAANIPPEGAPQGTAPPQVYWEEAAGSQPTRVVIDVEVRTEEELWERYPVEHFLVDRRAGTHPQRLTWAFTGSFFHRDTTTGFEVFIADVEKSLVALWYDPSALLNPREDMGNPYRGDASGLEVDATTLPKRGTRVRFILRPAPDTPE